MFNFMQMKSDFRERQPIGVKSEARWKVSNFSIIYDMSVVIFPSKILVCRGKNTEWL